MAFELISVSDDFEEMLQRAFNTGLQKVIFRKVFFCRVSNFGFLTAAQHTTEIIVLSRYLSLEGALKTVKLP